MIKGCQGFVGIWYQRGASAASLEPFRAPGLRTPIDNEPHVAAVRGGGPNAPTAFLSAHQAPLAPDRLVLFTRQGRMIAPGGSQ